MGELEDVINVVNYLNEENDERVDLLALSSPMQRKTNVSKDLDAALNMQKFDEMKNAKGGNLTSSEDLIQRMQNMEGKIKGVLASYVYRNFIFKDLL